MSDDNPDKLANALHAAAVWLERLHAPAGSVVVVRTAPGAARLGVWAPGLETVPTIVPTGDDEAEVCEAVGPLADDAIGRLSDGSRTQLLAALARGVTVQALLDPTARFFSLRAHDGKTVVELCSARMADET